MLCVRKGVVDDRGGDAEVVVCRCLRRGFRRGAHVEPMWRVERSWEEKELPRSGWGGLTMERMGDRSTWKGRVAGAGGGRREVRGETRACVGVKARRRVHAHAGVVVEASLEKDAAVGYTFAMATLEPTGARKGWRHERRRVSYSASIHVSSTPDICVVETTFGHEKERCLSRAQRSSRHFKSSSGCFLSSRIAVLDVP